MNQRLKAVHKTLTEFSLGRFSRKIKISKHFDEVDAISSGINMLGDKLKSITVSKNYFTGIFDAITEMVIVINMQKKIHDVNHACEKQLHYQKKSLVGKDIRVLCDHTSFILLDAFIKRLDYHSPLSYEFNMLDRLKAKIPVRITGTKLSNENDDKLILFTATNISVQHKTEGLIIRAMVDSQEKERLRLAKDLHDGLIQQLTAIKFFLNAIEDVTNPRRQRTLIKQSATELSNAISEVREICFDLMPQSLENFPLIQAIEAFCGRIRLIRQTVFKVSQSRNEPPLQHQLKIDLYRIIQEFVGNSIKHGEAKQIRIAFYYFHNKIKLKLNDDGKGFDTSQKSSGMGLKNISSRIKSHDGTAQIKSRINEGTFIQISIPVNKTSCKE